MIAVGYLFGRSFINPILTLQRGTHASPPASSTRASTSDRATSSASSATPSTRWPTGWSSCRKNVKRQERQAMFGRVAAGLVHDLSHPIQNIGNSARLLLRDDLDAESREMFRRTIERELATLKRFMDDLRNIVKPKPVERFAMDVNGSVAEIVESMRARRRTQRRHGRGAVTRRGRWSSKAIASRSAASTAT